MTVDKSIICNKMVDKLAFVFNQWYCKKYQMILMKGLVSCAAHASPSVSHVIFYPVLWTLKKKKKRSGSLNVEGSCSETPSIKITSSTPQPNTNSANSGTLQSFHKSIVLQVCLYFLLPYKPLCSSSNSRLPPWTTCICSSTRHTKYFSLTSSPF